MPSSVEQEGPARGRFLAGQWQKANAIARKFVAGFGVGSGELVYWCSCCRRLFVDAPTSTGKAGIRAGSCNVKFALRPDSSVVERGPEKAGVGGSIPSLATTF